MIRFPTSTLLVTAIMTAFWGYTVIDTLVRKFPGDVTYIDLGVIFILGLITGIALGLALASGRSHSNAG